MTFKLERHRVGRVRGRAAASLDESADIEARVFGAQGHGKVHRDLCAGVDVVDALDDFSDELEVLASHVLSSVRDTLTIGTSKPG